MSPPKNDIQEFESAVKEIAHQQYVLRLYIAGTTPQSTRAILNIKAICEEHLPGRYDLEVIDVYQQPKLAKNEQIIVVPAM